MTSVSFIQILALNTQTKPKTANNNSNSNSNTCNRINGECTVVGGGVVISHGNHLSAANLLNLLHKEVFHVS